MSDNLPEPPLRVLARVDETKNWSFIAWWLYRPNVNRWTLLSGTYKRIGSERLTVIPHKLNDERAAALINGAKGN